MGKKTQSQRKPVHNPLEAVTKFSADTVSSVKDDVIVKGTGDFFKQLLGPLLGGDTSSRSERSGSESIHANSKDSSETEIFSFSKQKNDRLAARSRRYNGENRPSPELRVEPGIDYHRDIIKSSERASKREFRELDSKVHEILAEIQKLVTSSKKLQTEFAHVALEEAPVTPDVYYINFFDWLLSVIKMAREKVDDSRAWLRVMNGKNSKKSGYWGMFKKHGTSFGLSNERAVATQSG